MIKQEIDDIIEESYLLSLPEAEIRNYLRHFLEACDTVLHRNISAWDDTRLIGVKITLLKVRLLLRDGSVPATHSVMEGDCESGEQCSVDSLAEQVFTIRHLILNLLASINSNLTKEVLEEEKRRKLDEKGNKNKHYFTKKAAFFFLFLLTAALLILFILY